MKDKNAMRERFNRWRKRGEQVGRAAPRTAKQAREMKSGEGFESSDCNNDPCSCTGCSNWD